MAPPPVAAPLARPWAGRWGAGGVPAAAGPGLAAGPVASPSWEETLALCEGAGIAVFPAAWGSKGTSVAGWPQMSAAEAWARTRRALASGAPLNLAGRTGGGWAVLDLDGKEGAEPEAALERLMERLRGSVLGLVRTARGFHVWVRVVEEVGNGYVAALGGELFSGPHLAMLPPSVHPSGCAYRWVHGPRMPAEAADLRALGLVPGGGLARAGGAGRPWLPAPEGVRAEFAALMAEAGVVRRDAAAQTVERCPWHADRAPSLSVHWEAALFHCFSPACGVQGGLGRLRRLLAVDTPSYRQGGEAAGSGDKWGYGDVEEEAERLARGYERLGEHGRAQAVRGCRRFFRVGRCSGCERRPAFPLSCGDGLCPRCLPGRLAADWRRHGGALPERFDLWRLWPRGLAGAPGAVAKARGRFREWRRRAGLEAGVYGVRWDRERGAAVLLMTPAGSPGPRSSEAFAVEAVARGRGPGEALAWLQREYAEEARAWRTDAELAALVEGARGRRRFQGFGSAYGGPREQDEGAPREAQAEARGKRVGLGRVSGGSCRSRRGPVRPACPFCGGAVELLRRTVPAEEVERVAGGWEWRGPPAGRGGAG